MKKKLFIVLGALFLSISLLFSYIVKDNKEENNKEISKVEKLLSKPEGIQAYTLNGERTDKTFDEMVNYYVIDTITCQNGSVATYNQSDNTVTMTNVHVPEYCVMNFKPGTYTLTIDPNGGYRASDNDSSIMKVNYQYGHVESISERKKDGYTLIGYEMFNTDTGSADDVKGSKFEFDSSTNIGTFTQGAANITLKATWGTNTYKVTLDNQGATTAGTAEVYYQYNTTNTINGVTCYYYTDVTLKTCVTNGTTITVPTKTGYTFDGYYTEVNGGGTQYVNASGTFINNIYKTTGSKTLYAKWTANKYKLTLTKGTGIGTIYYKINGASAYTSATATTTLDVNYDSTYYYYGVALTGYTYTKCTESSPCSAKMGAEVTSQTLTGTISKYKLTLTKGTGIGTIYYKINGASAYTSATATTTLDVNYDSTYYYYGVALTGYTYTKCTESSPCSAKMGAEVTSQTLTGTISKYKLTLTKGTGIGTIYYKINGASTYTSTTVTATLNVNYGSTYYYYGVASTGYTYTACTASSPCSGKMGTTEVSQTLTGTINTYKVTLAVVGGTGATSKNINYNSSGTFTGVKPNSGYTATGATVSCNGGATIGLSGTTVTVSKVLKAQTCTVTFKGITLLSKLLTDNPTIKTRTAFNTVFTEINTGTLYKTTESIAGSAAKDVYYFAGRAQNNWVKFGNFYWRIIRTNHDGSVRLLYAGENLNRTAHECLDTSRSYNTNYTNSMYVGYMYGTSGSLASNRTNTSDSTIKTYIDNWYSANLSSYTKYISTDAVYCNDRDVGSGTYVTMGTSFYFAPYTRVLNNKSPSYNCNNSKDAFSGNNSEAKLKYPISLMTLDEIMFAGGDSSTTRHNAWYMLNSSNETYFYSGYYWLLSPAAGPGSFASVFIIDRTTGTIGTSNVENNRYLRPVISIKSCALWSSGNGSSSSPYEINGGC